MSRVKEAPEQLAAGLPIVVCTGCGTSATALRRTCPHCGRPRAWYCGYCGRLCEPAQWQNPGVIAVDAPTMPGLVAGGVSGDGCAFGICRGCSERRIAAKRKEAGTMDAALHEHLAVWYPTHATELRRRAADIRHRATEKLKWCHMCSQHKPSSTFAREALRAEAGHRVLDQVNVCGECAAFYKREGSEKLQPALIEAARAYGNWTEPEIE